MNNEERRRRRLDRIIAEINRQAPGMYAALQPVTEDDEAEDDEPGAPTRSTT
ncbi:hypothetical protein [Nonomuraea sp. NPDC050643]|uniref:hypothetical protein n=1 Tax=Nonomuraea sp. NPDC050643 TaxID=3155660 RepID=UPI0033D3C9A9